MGLKRKPTESDIQNSQNNHNLITNYKIFCNPYTSTICQVEDIKLNKFIAHAYKRISLSLHFYV